MATSLKLSPLLTLVELSYVLIGDVNSLKVACTACDCVVFVAGRGGASSGYGGDSYGGGYGGGYGGDSYGSGGYDSGYGGGGYGSGGYGASGGGGYGGLYEASLKLTHKSVVFKSFMYNIVTSRW